MDLSNITKIENSLILLDIDGTLTVDDKNYIEGDLLNTIKKIPKSNSTFLCSNGSFSRNQEISKMLDIPLTNHLFKKPSRKCLPDIPEIENKVVVGDKYLTDGLFSLNIGASFLKVKRVVDGEEDFYVKFSYFIDDIFGPVIFKIFPFIKVLRLNHLVKNFIIFAPLFFAGEIFNKDILFNLIKAFLSFSFLASAVYIINDISDLKSDREHSWKSFRPLAIGILKKRDAVLFSISLIVLSLVLAYGLNMLYLMLSLYFFINILYTFKIKKKNILDIILIAFLYCIRILVGGLVSGVYISPWIILTVFFGALFITSCKRYSQIKNNNQKTLFGYDENLINFTMLFSAILSSGTYGIWSILEHKNTFLVYSTIPVVFVVFKMVEYTYKFPERSESPEILVFKDRWILATFCIWLLFVFYIFYLI